MEAQTLAKGKDQAAVALSVMTREKECRPATSSFAWENAERAMDSGIGRSRPTEACPGLLHGLVVPGDRVCVAPPDRSRLQSRARASDMQWAPTLT